MTNATATEAPPQGRIIVTDCDAPVFTDGTKWVATSGDLIGIGTTESEALVDLARQLQGVDDLPLGALSHV